MRIAFLISFSISFPASFSSSKITIALFRLFFLLTYFWFSSPYLLSRTLVIFLYFAKDTLPTFLFLILLYPEVVPVQFYSPLHDVFFYHLKKIEYPTSSGMILKAIKSSLLILPPLYCCRSWRHFLIFHLVFSPVVRLKYLTYYGKIPILH